jgi:NTP pyrophosphatase (non-canonical NTP hydrolase)
MHIQTWQKKATQMVEQRRGPKPPDHHLFKLMEELGELAEAHHKEFDLEEIGDEAADVLFSLVVYCETKGIDLNEARKTAKLRKRWGQ